MDTTIDAAAAIRRLLVRTGFAATPRQVRLGTVAGFAATLDAILAGGDSGAVDTPPPVFPPANRGDGPVGDEMRQLRGWWLDRLVTAAWPWAERRTLLWHGHWATSVERVDWPQALLMQNETERQMGGGPFDAFARAMLVDPALMIYLDASGNTARAPNENLARELMELFTLGHGNYTEDDVRQAARVLTGWRVDRTSTVPTAIFAANRHAKGPYKILGHSADFSADDLVNLLVAQPASPRYLATRMWGWLVADTPPSGASLDRIVRAYGKTYDLTAMFHAILTDPAFTAPKSVLVKQPVEYVVGALRSLGIRPATLPEEDRNAILSAMRGMGQALFEPPNVGGWPVGGAWLTTSATQARIQLAGRLARIADISPVATVAPANRPDAAATLLGIGDWTARTRAVLADAADDPQELVTLALISPEYTVSA